MEETDRIPAKIGNLFGFRFKINGKPDGAVIKTKCITILPSTGLTHPETGETVYREVFFDEIKIGEMRIRGYSFDYEWELVPGVWTFQIWYQEQKLAERSFFVYDP